MKVILDTNVLLSGLITPAGTPGRIVAAWIEGRFDLVLSTTQLAEIGRVLEYPRFSAGWAGMHSRSSSFCGRFISVLK